MAPPASGFDFDRVDELMRDDDDLFTGEVGEGVEKSIYRGQSKFVLKATSGNLRLYENVRPGVAQPFTWLAQGFGLRDRVSTDWQSVSKAADWRTPTGARYRPASLKKSAGSLHPPQIDVLGSVGRRFMNDGNHALYIAPSTNRDSYRVVLRRPDGSIMQLPGEYPMDDVAQKVLTSTDDGVLPTGNRSERRPGFLEGD